MSPRKTLGERSPDVGKSHSSPDSPRAEAPDVEIVAIAHFALDSVAKLRRLRPPVLEVHVVDERERQREHERPEIHECPSTRLPVHVAPKQAERQKQHRKHGLKWSSLAVCVPHPLPLEVQPPSGDLRGEGREPLELVAVLLPVDVVHQPVLRELAQCAVDGDLSDASRRLTLIDNRKVRRSDRLVEKGREHESEHCNPFSHEPPVQEDAPSGRQYRESNRRQSKESRRVVRVSQPEQKKNQKKLSICARTSAVIDPGECQP